MVHTTFCNLRIINCSALYIEQEEVRARHAQRATRNAARAMKNAVYLLLLQGECTERWTVRGARCAERGGDYLCICNAIWFKIDSAIESLPG